jgi:hypothetical protein
MLFELFQCIPVVPMTKVLLARIGTMIPISYMWLLLLGYLPAYVVQDPNLSNRPAFYCRPAEGTLAQVW